MRKYTPAGRAAWTSTAELNVTNKRVNAGEIYAAGVTDGKVNGKNFGNDDASSLRLDSQGKRVWSR